MRSTQALVAELRQFNHHEAADRLEALQQARALALGDAAAACMGIAQEANVWRALTAQDCALRIRGLRSV